MQQPSRAAKTYLEISEKPRMTRIDAQAPPLLRQDGTGSFDVRSRRIALAAVLIPLAVVVLTCLPSNVFVFGQNAIHGFAWWRESLESNVGALVNYLTGIDDGNGIEFALWRYITIAAAGMGLAAAGATCQGTLKNYLASPSTLGVVSGGTLGAIIYVLLFQLDSNDPFIAASSYQAYLGTLPVGAYLLEVAGRQLFSLAGCALVVIIVLGISFAVGRGKFSKVALVVMGQVIAGVVASVIGLIRYWITYAGDDDQLRQVVELSNGVFADVVIPAFSLACVVPVLACTVILLLLGRRLNMLSFSDEEARSMGLSVTRFRVLALALCTLITAFIVSFCGAVGFVGFMVPHFARRIVGADFKYLLPASAVGGALFLVVTYHLMTLCNLFNGALGMFCTVVGSALFVISLVVQRRRGNAAWN